MDNVTGTNLIFAALIFGSAAVVFTSVPFLIVLITGIKKADSQMSGGGTYISTLITAFIVHLCACVGFMLLIYALNIFYVAESNYISGKVFEVFWTEGGRSQVFSAVNAADNSNASKGAYTILNLVRVVLIYVYSLLPIIITLGAVTYAISISRKDTYGENYLTTIVYAGIAIVTGIAFYIAWAKIASLALFIPNGKDLLGLTREFWEAIIFQ